MPLSARPLLLLCVIAALMTMPGPIGAQSLDPPPTPPTAITLTSGWEIKFDPSDQGVKAGWPSGTVGTGWRPVSLPHVFNPKPVDSQFLGTIGWYRLQLKTPATPAGFTWALHFEGARRDATVWLNGKRIGTNTNQFEPFTLAATGLKPPGQVNQLVVRVSNLRSPLAREGWWNWGGLTRAVHLEPVGAAEWEDVGILSDVSCSRKATTCNAVARADGWLVNHTDKTIAPTLNATLTAPNGQDISTRTVTVTGLKPGERRRVRFPIEISGKPALWSPVHPNLYSSYVTVALNGKVTQLEQHDVGLRYVRVVDGQLYLNGHKLQLRGASIQEDLPGRGAALRPQDMDQIVADLVKLGANVARAQYPMPQGILDRLDKAGILFWNQAAVYHEDEDLKTVAGRRAALDKVRTSIIQGRNHPSVMAHSVANELSPYADSMPGDKDFLLKAAALEHNLDDTVPAALDLLCYPNIPRQSVYDAFGLLGINSYYGWYNGKAGAQSTAKFSGLKPFLESMHTMYPKQAQLITEFGAEATLNGPATEKQTYAFQTDYLEKTLAVTRELPWLAGAIYWTAREFYVKPEWDGGANRKDIETDALHNKGLLHYDGQPKPAFYAAQKLFKTVPVYAPK
jgi:beta-glucuronidase